MGKGKKVEAKSSTKEYKLWEAMRWRGEVCERWEKFENFLEDMGKRPS